MGQGVWRGIGVVLVFAAAVVAGALAWGARGPVARPSIAVRFEYDGSVDDGRLADGITIEVTRQLAQIDGLDVRSAVGATQYGNERQHVRAFGIERGAELVLEGLILSDAGVVRHMHASLISVSRGTVLWSRSFMPERNDLFLVIGSIGGAIADALDLRLRGRREHSLDPVLQTPFLIARALQGGSNVSRPEAVDLFERVSTEAPSFAPAFAALATTLGGYLSITGPPRLDSRMAAAARTAYAMNPAMAEANVAMGLLSARTCQWSRADAYFKEALKLDPGATAAYTDYVISTLLPLGRINEALEIVRQAQIADATSANLRRTLTYLQLQNNDYAGALENSGWVIAHYPDQEFTDQSHGRALYLSKRIDEALEWFKRGEVQWGHRGYLLALTAHDDEAKALADRHSDEPARQLLIYAGLNDVDRALSALRRTAIDNPWRALVWMGWPEIEPILRDDSRAAAIRSQLLRPGCSLSVSGP